jgi:hypothetical protein
VFYPGEAVLSICILVARSSLIVLIMTDDVGGLEPLRHHYCLCATLTPGLRSLGLGVVRRVAGPVDSMRTQAWLQ